jgi:hypothetical protein
MAMSTTHSKDSGRSEQNQKANTHKPTPSKVQEEEVAPDQPNYSRRAEDQPTKSSPTAGAGPAENEQTRQAHLDKEASMENANTQHHYQEHYKNFRHIRDIVGANIEDGSRRAEVLKELDAYAIWTDNKMRELEAIRH